MAAIDEIHESLGAILEEIAGVDPKTVEPDKKFVDDLDVDSLSMVEVALSVEERFGVRIPDEELSRLETVADAANYIAANLVAA